MALAIDIRRMSALVMAVLLTLTATSAMCVVSPLTAMGMPAESGAAAADACVYDFNGSMAACPHPGQEEMQGTVRSADSEPLPVALAGGELRPDVPSISHPGRVAGVYTSVPPIHSPPLRL